jgi:hypothetical protein
MEYVIVKAWNTDDLIKKVNSKIAEGFKIAGGVIWDNSAYMQAMNKEGQIKDFTRVDTSS